jgi:ABC-type sugar transport system permease subunit
VAIGLLLAFPAAVALLIGYVWPTGRTFAWSLQNRDPFGGGGQWVGFENYSLLAGDFFGSLPFTLGLALVPLLALLVVGPLLALAAHHAGKPIRLLTRVVLGVLMVLFAPVAIATGWLIEQVVQDLLVEVDFPGARLGVWLAVGLGLFGFTVAIGASLFLAVLRGREPGRSAWPAGLVVGGVAAAATIAVALQAFTFPFIMTRGGPIRTTATPILDAYQYGFLNFDFGAGTAVAGMVLVVLMLLGVGVAVLVILTGLRSEWAPAGPGKASVPAAVLAVLGLLLVLIVAGIGLWPWLAGLGRIDASTEIGEGLVLEGPSAAGLVLRTWAPTLLSTALGVGLAALAGFGIGGLRPLGRWSELLLLPFAPWLFVGVGPLVLAHWTAAEDPPIQRVDTFLGLVPPVWLVVPALFVFTLLFRGLARQATEAPPAAGYGRMLLRALPMVAVVGAATWLVQSQSLLWPLVIAFEPDTYPAQVFLIQQVGQFAFQPGSVALGLAYPLPMILIFAAGAVVLQLLYLDRLAIRVGREP